MSLLSSCVIFKSGNLRLQNLLVLYKISSIFNFKILLCIKIRFENIQISIIHCEIIIMYQKFELENLSKNGQEVFADSDTFPIKQCNFNSILHLETFRKIGQFLQKQLQVLNCCRCLVCLTNVATRLAVPCGHRLSCRPCLSSLVRQNNYYAVTAADGQVVLTDRRVPIQCCTCRSIIGQIITIH